MKSRRDFLKCAAVAGVSIGGMGALSSCANSFSTTSSQKKKPNVVVIIADDLGYADMSFLPDAPEDVKKYGTPGFDRLAKTGTYFKNAYGTSPICSPSRTGLITGRYQQRWGNYWYGDGGLPTRELTIPEHLSKSGFITAKYGKTHHNGGPKEFPTLHGFDEFLGFMFHTWDYIRLSQKDVEAYKAREGFKGNFGCQVVGPLLWAEGQGTKQEEAEKISFEDGFTTEIFTDRACEFIEREKGDKPFYLHVAHNAVHQPTYVVDEKWAKRVGARYVPWDRNADDWDYPYWEPNEERHQKFHKRWGHMGKVDPEGRRCYLANLLALDESVSRILDTLEKTGQRENTLVVFVSDNGGTINTYSINDPLSGFKYMFAEGGLRVPMIVSMPGRLPEGKVNEEAIVSTMDIFPTITSLAGLQTPDNLDGMSLLPVLKDKRKKQHEWLAWAQSRNSWVIRKGKWKLTNNVGWKHKDFRIKENGDVVEADKPYKYPNSPQLFNLEEDIGETTNLIDEHPKLAKQLRELYEAWDSQMAGRMDSTGQPRKNP
ncbi:sulfatase-like hydrolase/transferase [Sedimentisphaera salicampi]|uniref:Arylsulfatase n=1 Tax=Sedimentisphaera salicampi TaxID=1941349 RepID=A0A1W6LN10_9BACT|nr:sulfatase-like hydrolase/transferase [Sedimentisphaera salicampi]ARN57168.1 Arylsulfatase precursor [Sedimentisphaera salicampi]